MTGKNDAEIERLRIEENLGVREISRRIGKSPGTVSKVLKRLTLGPSQQGIQVQASAKLKKKLDLIDQICASIDGLKRIKAYIEKRFKDVSEASRPMLEDRIFKVEGEIRKWLSLYLETGKAILTLVEHAEFRKLTIEEIKNESPECARRILLRLQSVLASSGFGGNGEFTN